jgi:hypothetical protein
MAGITYSVARIAAGKVGTTAIVRTAATIAAAIVCTAGEMSAATVRMTPARCVATAAKVPAATATAVTTATAPAVLGQCRPRACQDQPQRACRQNTALDTHLPLLPLPLPAALFTGHDLIRPYLYNAVQGVWCT